MGRSLAFASLILGSVAITSAQSPSAATQSTQQDTKQPEVFLDNHRPLNPKKEKNPTSRTVSGSVADDTGHPLNGALVTLTRLKTNEKRTFFTKKDGRYSFEELAFTEDYEVQAKWKNGVSEARKLSQYDHTAKPIRLLQVSTPEGYNSTAASAAEAKKPEPKD